MGRQVHPHGDHTCYCPECGYEEVVGEGVKCNERVCPTCGAAMRAEEVGEERMKGSAMDEVLRFFEELRELVSKTLGGLRGDEEMSKKATSRAISMELVWDNIWTFLDAQYAEDSVWTWPIDVYLDDGDVYLLGAQEGALMRAPVSVVNNEVAFGAWEQVVEVHVPVTQRSSFTVQRQADGSARWLSIANTAILNRVGEIDSRSMFDSFVEHAEETGEYPPLIFYHEEGEAFHLGMTDLLAREGVVYVASGLMDEDTELAPYVIDAVEREPDAWGQSIGFDPGPDEPSFVYIEGAKIPVYREGVNREISILMEKHAAAVFTTMRMKEVLRMNASLKEALVSLGLSEEKVDEFEGKVDLVNDKARELITRESEAPGAEEAAGPEGEAVAASLEEAEAPSEGQAVELDEETAEALIHELVGSEAFEAVIQPINDAMLALVEKLTGVSEGVAAHTELLAELEPMRGRLELLERGDDAKQEEWTKDLPAKRGVIVSYRPREQDRDQPPGASSEGESYEDIAQETMAGMP